MNTKCEIKHDGLFHIMEFGEFCTKIETGLIDLTTELNPDYSSLVEIYSCPCNWDTVITRNPYSPEDYTITWTDAR